MEKRNRIYLDSNIFIDLLTLRMPDTYKYIELLRSTELKNLFISTLSIHISYYTLKIKPETQMAEDIRKMVNTISVCDLSLDIAKKTMEIGYKDYEDCLQYLSALDSNCDIILTRDKKDFDKIKKLIPSKISIKTL